MVAESVAPAVAAHGVDREGVELRSAAAHAGHVVTGVGIPVRPEHRILEMPPGVLAELLELVDQRRHPASALYSSRRIDGRKIAVFGPPLPVQVIDALVLLLEILAELAYGDRVVSVLEQGRDVPGVGVHVVIGLSQEQGHKQVGVASQMGAQGGGVVDPQLPHGRVVDVAALPADVPIVAHGVYLIAVLVLEPLGQVLRGPTGVDGIERAPQTVLVHLFVHGCVKDAEIVSVFADKTRWQVGATDSPVGKEGTERPDGRRTHLLDRGSADQVPLAEDLARDQGPRRIELGQRFQRTELGIQLGQPRVLRPCLLFQADQGVSGQASQLLDLRVYLARGIEVFGDLPVLLFFGCRAGGQIRPDPVVDADVTIPEPDDLPVDSLLGPPQTGEVFRSVQQFRRPHRLPDFVHCVGLGHYGIAVGLGQRVHLAVVELLPGLLILGAEASDRHGRQAQIALVHQEHVLEAVHVREVRLAEVEDVFPPLLLLVVLYASADDSGAGVVQDGLALVLHHQVHRVLPLVVVPNRHQDRRARVRQEPFLGVEPRLSPQVGVARQQDAVPQVPGRCLAGVEARHHRTVQFADSLQPQPMGLLILEIGRDHVTARAVDAGGGGGLRALEGIRRDELQVVKVDLELPLADGVEQVQIPPDFSGFLFTLRPVGGRQDDPLPAGEVDRQARGDMSAARGEELDAHRALAAPAVDPEREDVRFRRDA